MGMTYGTLISDVTPANLQKLDLRLSKVEFPPWSFHAFTNAMMSKGFQAALCTKCFQVFHYKLE